MPSTRISKQDSLDIAVDDLVRLGQMIEDIDVVASGSDQVEVRWRNGASWPVSVLSLDAVDETDAEGMVRQSADGPLFVVANRISEPARRYLSAQDWPWLDRRVGAHIPLPSHAIDIRFTDPGTTFGHQRRGRAGMGFSGARPSAEGPIRGKAGIAYAAAVLRTPHQPPTLRSVATAVDMSPTAVGNAAHLLVEAGLIEPGGEPTLPELFWALAEVWGPRDAVPVATAPGPTDPETADLPGDAGGWLLNGDLAALELGAPVFSTEARPRLLAPSPVALRRAARAYEQTTWAEAAAILAVPATPLVCRYRRPGGPDGSGWMLPEPLFAALDLAQDRERGREVLAAWTPGDADVVWR